MVIKVPQATTNEDGNYEYAQNRAKVQLIASIVSKLFRLRGAGIAHLPKIFYVAPVVYEILDKSFKGCKYVYAESYINIKDITFNKYGDNMTLI